MTLCTRTSKYVHNLTVNYKQITANFHGTSHRVAPHRTAPHLFRIQSLDHDVAVVAKGDRAQQVLQHRPYQGAWEDHRPATQPQDLRQGVVHGLHKKVARLQELLRYLDESGHDAAAVAAVAVAAATAAGTAERGV